MLLSTHAGPPSIRRLWMRQSEPHTIYHVSIDISKNNIMWSLVLAPANVASWYFKLCLSVCLYVHSSSNFWKSTYRLHWLSCTLYRVSSSLCFCVGSLFSLRCCEFCCHFNYKCKWLPEKIRFRSDLCVKWDSKLLPRIHSLCSMLKMVNTVDSEALV